MAMATTGGEGWRVERVPTGVPNLDRVIDGGLTRGGLALIVGGPGTGKTVLAEQMAFHWAAKGQSVLWLVTLGELNEKLLVNLSELSFYDPRQIGVGIQLVNLTRYLPQGLETQLDVIRETVRSGSYSFVIIDGFQSFRSFLNDQREVRLFLSELGAEMALAGITLVVTADSSPERYWESAEFTISDCILTLNRVLTEGRERRQLEVRKLRGRPAIGGAHTFTIDAAGLHVHPRIESLLRRNWGVAAMGMQSSGLPGLDTLLAGGLLEGSSTLVAGSLGTGKSMVASYFLAAGIAQSQPCLAFCLSDSPANYMQRAAAFGVPLQQASESGLLEVELYDPPRWDPDSCAERVMQAVEKRGIRRLVIDGIDPVEHDLDASGRTRDYLTAVTDYLQAHRVTSLFTYELPYLLGPELRFASPIVGQVASNLVLLRFAELEGRLRRLLTIVKTRYTRHSSVIAEILFEEGTLHVVPRSRIPETGEAEIAYGAQPHLHEGERLPP